MEEVEFFIFLYLLEFLFVFYTFGYTQDCVFWSLLGLSQSRSGMMK